MLTTTLSFANMHNHGELMANLFRARRHAPDREAFDHVLGAFHAGLSE